MPLGNSNTYSTPASTQTLATSRELYNSSLRALLENFSSANIKPISTNVLYDGVATTPNPGSLWYNTTTGGLYIDTGSFYDNTYAPFGTYRRLGVGTRAEGSLVSATANIGRMDPGELIVTINDTAGASNNRAYVVSVSGGAKKFVDIGTPGTGTVAVNELNNATRALLWLSFMQT